VLFRHQDQAGAQKTAVFERLKIWAASMKIVAASCSKYKWCKISQILFSELQIYGSCHKKSFNSTRIL
jgi:hypothetical protein